MKLPRLDEFDLKGKRVFVRGDLDVPLEKVKNAPGQEGVEYRVTDDTRLRLMKPTIDFLLKSGVAYIILAGHIGRPKDDGGISTFSIWPLLSPIFGETTSYFPGAITEGSLSISEDDGKVILIENLRFYPGEENNDREFAKKLASLADFYVNECFSTSHRQHASFVGVPQFLPHAAGFHLLKEIEMLSKVLENPRKPVVVVIGGAKEDKLAYVPKFTKRARLDSTSAKRADFILIGGGLVKKALLRPSELEGFGGQDTQNVLARLTSDGRDITVESAKRLAALIEKAGTVVWNGPMGVYEDERDLEGTRIIAEAITNSRALKIAGGGDTEVVIDRLGLREKFDWISSGGGAMLEFLARGDLPGLAALRE